jgi:hypothetical protein
LRIQSHELLLLRSRSSAKRTVYHKSHDNKTEFLENGFMKTTNSQYWACQIAGWDAYSFRAGLSTGVIANGWRRSVVIGYLLFFLYSIGLTHLLRAEIHRRNWTSLPLPRALVRLAPTSILIAAVQSALVVGVYKALDGRLGEWSQPSAIAYMLIGLSVIDTIWAVLYLSIATFRHSREVSRNEMRMKVLIPTTV